MKKIVFGLVFSSLILGACGNKTHNYEYDPFGSTAQEEKNTSYSSSFSSKKSTNYSSSSSNYYSSSSSSEENTRENEISTITEEQKRTLIAFAQLDCEDRGYNLKYQGIDTWNVAVNYINDQNRWIVTCNDANVGKVKAIYEWDGKKDSGATLIYLLISGNELINNLNN